MITLGAGRGSCHGRDGACGHHHHSHQRFLRGTLSGVVSARVMVENEPSSAGPGDISRRMEGGDLDAVVGSQDGVDPFSLGEEGGLGGGGVDRVGVRTRLLLGEESAWSAEEWVGAEVVQQAAVRFRDRREVGNCRGQNSEVEFDIDSWPPQDSARYSLATSVHQTESSGDSSWPFLLPDCCF